MSTRPTPLGAALRSLFLPGWGQLVTRRPALGRALILLSGLSAVAGLTIFLFVEPLEIAARLADPDVLLAVVAANLVYAVLRLVSTGHAWRAGGGKGWLVVVVLALVVAIPHAALAWVGLETRASLVGVFEPATLSVAADTTTTTVPTTTTTTIVDLGPIVTAPGQYGEDDTEATPAAPWQPFGTERLNILLLGGDAGPGRRGLRTDTMIVASIDPISGDAALFGLPRNFGAPTLSDGSPVPVSQLGHVYGWGAKNPDLFPGPDPGAGAVRDAAENLTGLDIDYFALVDLTGFADLVDAFGGVELEVGEAVDGPLYDPVGGGYQMVRIMPGRQHLDGAHALAYSRARYGSSDYVRMGRQRCLLAAMAAEADLLGLFGRLDGILDAVDAHLVTDLPVEVVPELIRLSPRVSAAGIRLMGFGPDWGAGRSPTGHVIPDIERIRDAVRMVIEDPGRAPEVGALPADGRC